MPTNKPPGRDHHESDREFEDRIRDHGKIVTAPTGTSEDEVIDKLTGADKLPPIGQELGRAPSAPPFDPHEGREVAPGREFGDQPEPMISTLVFIGTDQGGDFEDAIHKLVDAAEGMGLHYITATVGSLDLDKHLDGLTVIAEEVNPEEEEEDDGEDEEKPEKDEGEQF
jgi:hypothetical protein